MDVIWLAEHEMKPSPIETLTIPEFQLKYVLVPLAVAVVALALALALALLVVSPCRCTLLTKT